MPATGDCFISDRQFKLGFVQDREGILKEKEEQMCSTSDVRNLANEGEDGP